MATPLSWLIAESGSSTVKLPLQEILTQPKRTKEKYRTGRLYTFRLLK
jgi:hypothetical protein